MAYLWGLLGPMLAVVVVLELVLLYGAPLTFARLAFLKVGLDRRLHVPAGQLRGELPIPVLYDGVDHVVRSSEEARAAWVRPTYKWFGFNRSLAIGRVSVVVDREENPSSYREPAAEPTVTIEMTVRWLPVPASVIVWLPLLFLFLAAHDPAVGAVMFACGLLASGLQVLFAYLRIKPALSVVADEIEMELLKPVGLAARPPAEP